MRIVNGLGSDGTFSAHNTVVTANASKAVRRLRRSGTMDATGKKALMLGAKLLDNIVQGSAFIESTDVSGLTQPTSTEDVWAFNHALSVITELQLSEHHTIADAFRSIRETVTRIVTEGKADLAEDELQALEHFFNTLNQVFFTDIYNGLLPIRS